jgi:hypothetical protein
VVRRNLARHNLEAAGNNPALARALTSQAPLHQQSQAPRQLSSRFAWQQRSPREARLREHTPKLVKAS